MFLAGSSIGRLALLLLLAWQPGAPVTTDAETLAKTTGKLSYDRDIRPILSENCFYCHGEDSARRKAKLRLDIPEIALEKGAIKPGEPDASEMIKRIFSSDPDEQMPPPDSNRHVTEGQKQLLRKWITQGANYERHWSFVPPVQAPLPSVSDPSWVHNAIDTFVLAKLDANGLRPSPEAPMERLLRRMSLDLTGLPPTQNQLKRWMRQSLPVEVAADELLDSPHYGERMASDWLDLARYADTHGFNNDSRREMWRWRDWVIDSFNHNRPYNEFITEQLAGDLLPNPTAEQIIATGFNRNHVINSEGGIIDEEYRVEYVADRVRTTSIAWLGLTFECSRCHDHKFDPISQKDYYRLFAFFNNIDETGEDGRFANAAPIFSSPTPAQQKEMGIATDRIRNARSKLESRIRSTDWSDVGFEDLLSEKESPEQNETNLTLRISVSCGKEALAITNDATHKSIQVNGAVQTTRGPLGKGAIAFEGGNLETDSLPQSETGKGWTISFWIKPGVLDSNSVLVSTANFDVPETSQSYGSGVQVLLNTNRQIDLRVATRWPGYSANIVTRKGLPADQWSYVVIANEGGMPAKVLRIFANGKELDRDVIHDDALGHISLSGKALIGGGLKTAAPFRGALAEMKIVGGKPDLGLVRVVSETSALQLAIKTDASKRTPAQKKSLRLKWLAETDPACASLQEKLQKNRERLLELEREAPTTMVMRERTVPRKTYLLARGAYDHPKEELQPDVPDNLLPFPANAPRNRLGLAMWLTDRRQPMTARVVVNRFWQSLFGNGLVPSSDNFGLQGDYPTHPELLDWLAVEFMETGWDVKKLLRLIVTSSTYRQDSKFSDKIEDPENRLLSRGPRQRLTAEMLRDQALALSGLLTDELGGPPVFPYQPAGLYKGIVVAANYPGTSYTESTGADLYRRTLYTFLKRTVPHPVLSTFDAPDREVCVARRTRTNTPLQALALMNEPLQLEAAARLAERMSAEGGSTAASRLSFAFELATARKPNQRELDALLGLLTKRLREYEKNPDRAIGVSGTGETRAELAAYRDVASLLLNLDETITRN